MRNQVMLRSELPEEVVRGMWIEPVHDINAAVASALVRMGREAEIAVVPEGPLVLPLLDP